MRVIEKAEPPPGSVVSRALPRVDYADTYRRRIPAEASGDVSFFAWRCLSSTPGWVMALMRVRDRFVRLAGLDWKQIGDVERLGASIEGPPAFEPGSTVAIFTVYERSADELVIGIDDKHLDFRIVFSLEDSQAARWLYLTTVVLFHGRIGRLYFHVLPVKAIHRLIVPSMLRRMTPTS